MNNLGMANSQDSSICFNQTPLWVAAMLDFSKPLFNASTYTFQSLSLHPGFSYVSDTLKLRLPSIYPHVNYTLASQLARPFPIWNHPFPCFPNEPDWYTIGRQKSPTQHGFLYFKARKAASSTLAGIALRIAKAKAKLHFTTTLDRSPIKNNITHCLTRYGHPAASWLKYDKRDRHKSFLWTILREPTRRDISEFFHFGVSRAKLNPSLKSFQSYHDQTLYLHEYYLQFLSTDATYQQWQQTQYDKNKNKDMNKKAKANRPLNARITSPVHAPDKNDDLLYVETVRKIMMDYDFIGITERLHESLVTLQLLLNLTTSDILYLSAKTNGGWDDGLFQHQCYFIHPPIISPQLQKYLWDETSDDHPWMYKRRGSNLLYVAANRSLDATIALFHPTLFQAQLRRYRWALQVVQERCNDKIRYPCSPGGVFRDHHDCLLWDSGCGNDCIDAVAQELGL